MNTSGMPKLDLHDDADSYSSGFQSGFSTREHGDILSLSDATPTNTIAEQSATNAISSSDSHLQATDTDPSPYIPFIGSSEVAEDSRSQEGDEENRPFEGSGRIKLGSKGCSVSWSGPHSNVSATWPEREGSGELHTHTHSKILITIPHAYILRMTEVTQNGEKREGQ